LEYGDEDYNANPDSGDHHCRFFSLA